MEITSYYAFFAEQPTKRYPCIIYLERVFKKVHCHIADLPRATKYCKLRNWDSDNCTVVVEITKNHIVQEKRSTELLRYGNLDHAISELRKLGHLK